MRGLLAAVLGAALVGGAGAASYHDPQTAQHLREHLCAIEKPSWGLGYLLRHYVTPNIFLSIGVLGMFIILLAVIFYCGFTSYREDIYDLWKTWGLSVPDLPSNPPEDTRINDLITELELLKLDRDDLQRQLNQTLERKQPQTNLCPPNLCETKLEVLGSTPIASSDSVSDVRTRKSSPTLLEPNLTKELNSKANINEPKLKGSSSNTTSAVNQNVVNKPPHMPPARVSSSACNSAPSRHNVLKRKTSEPASTVRNQGGESPDQCIGTSGNLSETLAARVQKPPVPTMPHTQTENQQPSRAYWMANGNPPIPRMQRNLTEGKLERNTDAEVRCRVLARKLHDTESIAQSLRTELDIIKREREIVSSVEKEKAVLVRRVDVLVREKRDTMKQLATSQAELRNTKRSLQKAHTNHEQLLTQLETLKKGQRTAHKEKKVLTKQLDTTRKEFSQLKTRFENFKKPGTIPERKMRNPEKDCNIPKPVYWNRHSVGTQVSQDYSGQLHSTSHNLEKSFVMSKVEQQKKANSAAMLPPIKCESGDEQDLDMRSEGEEMSTLQHRFVNSRRKFDIKRVQRTLMKLERNVQLNIRKRRSRELQREDSDTGKVTIVEEEDVTDSLTELYLSRVSNWSSEISVEHPTDVSRCGSVILENPERLETTPEGEAADQTSLQEQQESSEKDSGSEVLTEETEEAVSMEEIDETSQYQQEEVEEAEPNQQSTEEEEEEEEEREEQDGEEDEENEVELGDDDGDEDDKELQRDGSVAFTENPDMDSDTDQGEGENFHSAGADVQLLSVVMELSANSADVILKTVSSDDSVCTVCTSPSCELPHESCSNDVHCMDSNCSCCKKEDQISAEAEVSSSGDTDNSSAEPTPPENKKSELLADMFDTEVDHQLWLVQQGQLMDFNSNDRFPSLDEGDGLQVTSAPEEDEEAGESSSSNSSSSSSSSSTDVSESPSPSAHSSEFRIKSQEILARPISPDGTIRSVSCFTQSNERRLVSDSPAFKRFLQSFEPWDTASEAAGNITNKSRRSSALFSPTSESESIF